MKNNAIGFAVVILAFAGLPSVGNSQATSKSDRSLATSVDLPMSEFFDTVVVPVKLNQSRTLNCILDTGMPEGMFVMRREAVEGCGLKYAAAANVQGAGAGMKVADLANGVSLEAGGIEWQEQRVIVLREPGRLAHLGVDGVFGATLFANRVIQFDFEKNLVRAWQPDHFSSDSAGEKIAIAIRNTKLYVQVTATIQGKDQNLELLLDTGANNGLSINPSREGAFSPPEPVISTYLGSGVGGDLTGSIGRIDKLKIGQTELNDVATFFPDRRGVDGDGSIGMELLRKFLVTIDYGNKSIYLKPNSTFDEPTEFSMAGLTVLPDDHGVLRIHSVIDESPADDAGVQVGDILKATDGRKLDFAEFYRVGWTSPGKEIVLTLSREGRDFDCRLKLRRLR